MRGLPLFVVLGLASLLVLETSSRAPAAPLEWKLIEGLPAKDFDRRWDELRQGWFRLTTLRAFDLAGEPRLAAVWIRNTDDREWGSKYGLSAARLTAELRRLQAEDLRCVELSAFDDGGEAGYLVAWVKDKEHHNWLAQEGLTHEALERELVMQRGRGLRPIAFQGFNLGKEVRYNLVWLENKEQLKWSLDHDVAAAQVTPRLAAMRENGLSPARYTSYAAGGVALCGFLSVENREHLDWAVFRDLKETEFRAQFDERKDKFRLADFEAYDSGKGTRCSGIWVENK